MRSAPPRPSSLAMLRPLRPAAGAWRRRPAAASGCPREPDARRGRSVGAQVTLARRGGNGPASSACRGGDAARHSVHLAIDLLEVLFPDWRGDALSLASGPMVECGLLSLLGEDALPQRVLAVRLPLWRALCGGPPAWPGCRMIDPTSEAAIPMPAHAAEAIKGGQAGGVVIRGPPDSGRAAVAAALARRIGLVPIETPLAVFRDDRAFTTACHAAGWLPVLRLAPDLGESALLGEASGPVAVLAGRHGAVQGDRLIEFFSVPPPHPERLLRWQAELGKHAIDPLTLGAAILRSGMIETVARAAGMRASAGAAAE
jgi:hypothetical protein